MAFAELQFSAHANNLPPIIMEPTMNPTFSATTAKGTNSYALPFGGRFADKPPIDFCPPNSLSLSQRTMHGLQQELLGYGCIASTASTKTGLEAVAECLEAMANGTAEPLLFLSSLDPGVGKTTLIKHHILA